MPLVINWQNVIQGIETNVYRIIALNVTFSR